MRIVSVAAALAMMSTAAFAQDEAMPPPTGDAEAGMQVFDRNCVACHVVVNDAGETLAGRNAHVGPNLYNVVARGIAKYPDFDYSESILAYGETGAMWTEEHFLGYVQNPTDFLREVLDDRRARGAMAFQLRDSEDAANVYAFLASLAPAEPAE